MFNLKEVVSMQPLFYLGVVVTGCKENSKCLGYYISCFGKKGGQVQILPDKFTILTTTKNPPRLAERNIYSFLM